MMPNGSNKQLVITFRKRDEWALDYLKMIISGKKDLGIKTSLSYEIVRLIKQGLQSNTEIPDAVRQKFSEHIRRLADEPIRGYSDGATPITPPEDGASL